MNLEPIDILTGGFPCQDLSVAGKRKGLSGERSGLFYEIVRIAGGLRPRWLFLENVPGLRSSGDGRDFWDVLAALDELGYGVSWTGLDAQYSGLAQRRERVLIVGYLGAACPPEILFERDGVSGDSPPCKTTGNDYRGGVARGSGDGGGGVEKDVLDMADSCGAGVEERRVIGMTEQPCGSNQGIGRGGAVVVAPTLRCGGREDGAGSSGENTPIVVAASVGGGARGAGRTSEEIGDQVIVDGGAALSGFASRFPGADAHEEFVCEGRPRRLTPRECERLQGFPDDWTLVPWRNKHGRVREMADSPRYRMIGNAVAVPVARWVLGRIRAFDGAHSVGELFAGIGGFGLAAERVGMRVAWASEINEQSRAVYARRFPGTELLGDVRGL